MSPEINEPIRCAAPRKRTGKKSISNAEHIEISFFAEFVEKPRDDGSTDIYAI